MCDISICIPYYERWKAFKRTLGSFWVHGYYPGRGIEISVCDDGSIRQPLKEDKRYTLTTLPKKPFWYTPCVPINRAVEASKGKVLVLQSPETYHHDPVLYNMFDMMEDYKDVILVACQDTAGGRTDKWFCHPEYEPNKFWWCQMLSRAFFDEVGGFDESYRFFNHGEDGDFAIRLSEAGANWKWMKEGYVVHGWKGHFKKVKKKPHEKLERDHGKITQDRYHTH
jgi:hypothetical protein